MGAGTRDLASNKNPADSLYVLILLTRVHVSLLLQIPPILVAALFLLKYNTGKYKFYHLSFLFEFIVFTLLTEPERSRQLCIFS